jgi:hypothetical protein
MGFRFLSYCISKHDSDSNNAPHCCKYELGDLSLNEKTAAKGGRTTMRNSKNDVNIGLEILELDSHRRFI